MLFISFEAFGGRGGKGGKGGRGGKGGKGGRGGRGGIGGKGGSYIHYGHRGDGNRYGDNSYGGYGDKNYRSYGDNNYGGYGDSYQETRYYANGSDGSDGRRGNDGKNGRHGEDGHNGKNGNDGNITIHILNEDGTISKVLDSPLDIKLNEFEIFKTDFDIIEPGDTIVLTNISIQNDSNIPFPNLTLLADEKYVINKNDIKQQNIPIGETIINEKLLLEVKGFEFDANSSQWTQDIDIKLFAYFGNRRLLNVISKPIKLQTPTSFTFTGPKIMSGGEFTQGSINFKNISKKPKDIEYELIYPTHIRCDTLQSRDPFHIKKQLDKVEGSIDIKVPFFGCDDAVLFNTYLFEIKLYRQGYLIQTQRFPIEISPAYVPVDPNNNPFDVLFVTSVETKDKDFQYVLFHLKKLELLVNFIDLKRNAQPFYKGENWKDGWRNKTIIFLIGDGDESEKEFYENYIGNYIVSNFVDSKTKFDTGLLIIKSSELSNYWGLRNCLINEYEIFDYPDLTDKFSVNSPTLNDMKKAISKKLNNIQQNNLSKYVHHLDLEFHPEKLEGTKYKYGKASYGIMKLDKTTRLKFHHHGCNNLLERDIVQSLSISKKLDLLTKGKIKNEDCQLYLFIDLWSEFLYPDCELFKFNILKSILDQKKDYLENQEIMICVWIVLVELNSHVTGLLSHSKQKKENIDYFRVIKKQIKRMFFGNYDKKEGLSKLFKKMKIETEKDKIADYVQGLSHQTLKEKDFEKISIVLHTDEFIPLPKLDLKLDQKTDLGVFSSLETD